MSASAPSDEARRSALRAEIATLKHAGIGSHLTTQTPQTTHYVLQVEDERNATQSLMAAWGNAAIDSEAREEMLHLLRGARCGVKIDWDRYLGGQERSVRVTFRGNEQSRKHPAWQRWLDAGKLGMWLSFGEGDRLSRATLIPIDANITEDNATWQWQMRGYDLRMTRTHLTDHYNRAAHLKGGKFSLKRTEARTASIALMVESITCQADQRTRKSGSLACAVAGMTLAQEATELKITGLTFEQAVQERNATQVGLMQGGIERLDLHYQKAGQESNVSLEHLASEVNASIADTLAYRAHTTLANFRISTQGADGKKVHISGEDLVYGSGLKGIYDLRSRLDLLAKARAKGPRDDNTTKSEQWYLEEMLSDVIHHGATAMVAPLRIGALGIHAGGIDHVFAKTQLLLKATLSPNTIDVRRPSAVMLMLAQLQAKGRWVIAERDYEYLLGTLPIKIQMMVKIFARHHKGNAVFEVQFDHGHLRINGKQVM